MCFNKEMTLCFTITAILMGCWIYSGTTIWRNIPKWRLLRMSMCFFFFAIMEGLQFVDYLVIDKCDDPVNIISTLLGWIHIAFQPLFSNIAMSAVDKKNLNKERDQIWKFIFKLCTVIGVMMSLRGIIPFGGKSLIDGDFLKMCNPSSDGLCGENTCSHTGIYHVRWTFLLLRSSYPFPSISAHGFMMFVVPLLMGSIFEAIVLFISGPALAMLFKVSDGERASIWCFFSIMETAVTMCSQLLVLYRGRKQEKQE